MTQLVFKHGVNVFGCHPETLWALDRCVEAWAFTGKNVTVTSARGDKHSRKSRHYSGFAVDLRTRDLNDDEINQIMSKLRGLLGKDYDIILESNHLHIEYDPQDKHDYPKEQPHS